MYLFSVIPNKSQCNILSLPELEKLIHSLITISFVLLLTVRVKGDRNLEDLLVMYNKPPRWNEEVCCQFKFV